MPPSEIRAVENDPQVTDGTGGSARGHAAALLRPGSRRSPQRRLPAQAAFRSRHDGWPPTTWGLERRLRRQYSSASMIVITRRVTAGSDGSGEWYVRL
jgi:hypothetical protein